MGLSEKQKEEMKNETKKLLDSFAKSLSGVKLSANKKESVSEGFREKSVMQTDEEFKKIMFENAPNSNHAFIIAEKKQW